MPEKKLKKGKFFIGTSGWNYRPWRGIFYPEGLKQKDEFSYFRQHFKTVELNNSFYMLPLVQTFEKWRDITEDDFVFAVKASRFITHNKRLLDPQESFVRFAERIDILGKKLGPVLFQLPPGMENNPERLQIFLETISDHGYRCTFEFRNPGWYNDEIYKILKNFNIAFCIYELEYHQSPILTTADFVYIRLHGPGKKYQGSYSDKTLKEWADRMNKWSKEGKDVYIYFDNDQNAYAAFNAMTLKKMLGS